ncbi:hypothetical protein WJX74_007974 [Apatococcus lobatus]|uniref:Uncharacterized protein n=1 Tax=Apatococcus lobatus TaxID=904363 RepID=A0AAW1R2Z6_9CHLO
MRITAAAAAGVRSCTLTRQPSQQAWAVLGHGAAGWLPLLPQRQELPKGGMCRSNKICVKGSRVDVLSGAQPLHTGARVAAQAATTALLLQHKVPVAGLAGHAPAQPFRWQLF